MSSDSSSHPNRGWRQDATVPNNPAAAKTPEQQHDTVPAHHAPARKDGWKQGGAGGAGQEAKRDWQRPAAPPPGARRGWWNRKTKVGLVAVTFLALSGILAWALYVIWPLKPPQLVVPVADNAQDLAVPADPAGRQALEALAGWAESGAPIKVRRGDLSPDNAAWEGWLADARGSLSNRAERVILFLAAHGGADGQGPYLIPQNADPRDHTRLVRLAEVLERLRALPDKTPKLLLLDAAQVPADWGLGILHNDFARGLKGLQPQIDSVPNLVVICSADEDQRSWASEEWGTTVFAHYLIEGLKGDAPAVTGRVTAQELFDHVSGKVAQWVRHNRNAAQTPILLGGKDRASRMELVPTDPTYKAPGLPDGPRKAPADLRRAWEECRQLAGRSPSPAVTAPHLWRQYLETMLRYEQLLRAEDGASATALKGQLDTLRERITQAERLTQELNSAHNTLALSAALGGSLPAADDEALVRQFRTLWEGDAAPEDYQKKWPVLQSARPDARRTGRLVRARLSGLLLDRAAEDPQHNLARACATQKAIDDVDTVRRPRAAESHFMVMLQRDLVEKPDWAVVGKALTVRRLAEGAALGLGQEEGGRLPAFSEQVFPWIRKQVEEADRERRLGEDLTLASDRWPDAGKHLDRAQDLYRQARRGALQVRRSLQVRAEVLTALPYYSRWLAAHPGEADDPRAPVYQLWREAHYLDRRLEQPDPDALVKIDKLDDGDPRPGTLGERAKSVSRALAGLKGRFDRRCESLRPLHSLQSRWHETEDALLVPFIEPGLRLQLLDNSRAIAYEIHAAPRKEGEGQALTAQESSAQAREGGRRQGRMALAVLGEEWFNRTRDQGPEYARVSDWVDNPEAPAWWQSLTRAGDQVAGRWARLSRDVSEGTRKGRDAADLKAAASQLREAARWARHLDGSAVPRLAPLDPIEEYRRLQLHDLLCWQAERTHLDYWSDEDPAPPYYRSAGRLYAAEAGALAGENRSDLNREQKARRLAAAAQLRARLEAPGQLKASWYDGTRFRSDREVYNLTDETRLTRVYRVEPEGAVPEGIPVVWAQRGKYLRPTHDDSGRRVLEDLAPGRPATVRYDLEPEPREARYPLPADESEHALHGLFRGQRFGAATPIHLYRLPDVVAHQQLRPRTGGVAVLVPRELYDRHAGRNTAIAIVLDCSGSMTATRGGKTRMARALGALEAVLSNLPQGVTVSLRAFSHEGFEDRSELVWEPRTWDPARTRARIDALRKRLKPYGNTPLVQSTIEAKRDLPGSKPSRAIVVLTDGGDSFESPEAIPGRLREQFRNSGILITAIGFEQTFATDQEVKASAQFRRGVQALGGHYYPAADDKELANRLREAILPLRFWIERGSDGAPPDQRALEGQNIGTLDGSIHWVQNLAPAAYNLEVLFQPGTKPVERPIRIDRGDFLLVKILPGEDGLVFERALFLDVHRLYERVLARAHDRTQDWLLAVLQNQYRDNGDLQLMTTAEKATDRRFVGGHLEQVRPTLAWYQVSPRGSQDPSALALRFGPLSGYPAPAWGLDVGEWPRKAPSVLEGWWTGKEIAVPDDNHPFARVLQRSQGDFSLGMAGRPVKARFKDNELTDVTLEGVRIEQRPVQTRPGAPAENVSCLVVRLRYPRGKPFIVHVPGTEGYEHRLYTAAGKYTGIFYPWTEDRARAELKHLSLISLEGFKADCENAASHVRLDLGSPDHSPLPSPVNLHRD